MAIRSALVAVSSRRQMTARCSNPQVWRDVHMGYCMPRGGVSCPSLARLTSVRSTDRKTLSIASILSLTRCLETSALPLPDPTHAGIEDSCKNLVQNIIPHVADRTIWAPLPALRAVVQHSDVRTESCLGYIVKTVGLRDTGTKVRSIRYILLRGKIIGNIASYTALRCCATCQS